MPKPNFRYEKNNKDYLSNQERGCYLRKPVNSISKLLHECSSEEVNKITEYKSSSSINSIKDVQNNKQAKGGDKYVAGDRDGGKSLGDERKVVKNVTKKSFSPTEYKIKRGKVYIIEVNTLGSVQESAIIHIVDNHDETYDYKNSPKLSPHSLDKFSLCVSESHLACCSDESKRTNINTDANSCFNYKEHVTSRPYHAQKFQRNAFNTTVRNNKRVNKQEEVEEKPVYNRLMTLLRDLAEVKSEAKWAESELNCVTEDQERKANNNSSRQRGDDSPIAAHNKQKTEYMNNDLLPIKNPSPYQSQFYALDEKACKEPISNEGQTISKPKQTDQVIPQILSSKYFIPPNAENKPIVLPIVSIPDATKCLKCKKLPPITSKLSTLDSVSSRTYPINSLTSTVSCPVISKTLISNLKKSNLSSSSKCPTRNQLNSNAITVPNSLLCSKLSSETQKNASVQTPKVSLKSTFCRKHPSFDRTCRHSAAIKHRIVNKASLGLLERAKKPITLSAFVENDQFLLNSVSLKEPRPQILQSPMPSLICPKNVDLRNGKGCKQVQPKGPFVKKESTQNKCTPRKSAKTVVKSKPQSIKIKPSIPAKVKPVESTSPSLLKSNDRKLINEFQKMFTLTSLTSPIAGNSSPPVVRKITRADIWETISPHEHPPYEGQSELLPKKSQILLQRKENLISKQFWDFKDLKNVENSKDLRYTETETFQTGKYKPKSEIETYRKLCCPQKRSLIKSLYERNESQTFPDNFVHNKQIGVPSDIKQTVIPNDGSQIEIRTNGGSIKNIYFKMKFNPDTGNVELDITKVDLNKIKPSNLNDTNQTKRMKNENYVQQVEDKEPYTGKDENKNHRKVSIRLKKGKSKSTRLQKKVFKDFTQMYPQGFDVATSYCSHLTSCESGVTINGISEQESISKTYSLKCLGGNNYYCRNTLEKNHEIFKTESHETVSHIFANMNSKVKREKYYQTSTDKKSSKTTSGKSARTILSAKFNEITHLITKFFKSLKKVIISRCRSRRPHESCHLATNKSTTTEYQWSSTADKSESSKDRITKSYEITNIYQSTKQFYLTDTDELSLSFENKTSEEHNIETNVVVKEKTSTKRRYRRKSLREDDWKVVKESHESIFSIKRLNESKIMRIRSTLKSLMMTNETSANIEGNCATGNQPIAPKSESKTLKITEVINHKTNLNGLLNHNNGKGFNSEEIEIRRKSKRLDKGKASNCESVRKGEKITYQEFCSLNNRKFDNKLYHSNNRIYQTNKGLRT